MCQLSDDFVTKIEKWKYTWKVMENNNLEEKSYIELPLYMDETRSKLMISLYIPYDKVDREIGSSYYTKGVALTLLNN